MKRNTQKAFTLIELLTVIGIIALLLSLAMPAYNMVRIKAKEMAVKATISAVSQGLETFNNDYGFYPESHKSLALNPRPVYAAGNATTNLAAANVFQTGLADLGAHHLTEALIGVDMLGYQKKHEYFVNTSGQPVDAYGNVAKRDTYLDTKNLKLATIHDMKGDNDAEITGNKNLVIADGFYNEPERQRPFLYYKANTRGFNIAGIYTYWDNNHLTNFWGGMWWDKNNTSNPQDVTNYVQGDMKNFQNYIWDPRSSNGSLVSPTARPYNKDSFLIITAGRDGEYGTEDDICNFDHVTGK